MEINRAVGVICLDVARVGIHEGNMLVALLRYIEIMVLECSYLSRYRVCRCSRERIRCHQLVPNCIVRVDGCNDIVFFDYHLFSERFARPFVGLGLGDSDSCSLSVCIKSFTIGFENATVIGEQCAIIRSLVRDLDSYFAIGCVGEESAFVDFIVNIVFVCEIQ